MCSTGRFVTAEAGKGWGVGGSIFDQLLRVVGGANSAGVAFPPRPIKLRREALPEAEAVRSARDLREHIEGGGEIRVFLDSRGLAGAAAVQVERFLIDSARRG